MALLLLKQLAACSVEGLASLFRVVVAGAGQLLREPESDTIGRSERRRGRDGRADPVLACYASKTLRFYADDLPNGGLFAAGVLSYR